MVCYNSIYSQLFNLIPRYRFEKVVKKSGGDRYCKLTVRGLAAYQELKH